jgi:hypothetical protein
MDKQIFSPGNEFNPNPSKKPRSFKPVLVGIGIVILLVLLWFVYMVFFSPEARYEFAAQKSYEQAMKSINAYEEAMRNDTYGGKTPEETLNMFIAALEKEDLELASKYFLLREDGTSNPQWLEGMKKMKEQDGLRVIIENLQEAKITEKNENLKTAWFSIFDKKGIIIKEILLKFNEYSGVWKIENL